MSPTVVAATVAVGGAGAVVRAVGGRRRQVRMAAVARNCELGGGAGCGVLGTAPGARGHGRGSRAGGCVWLPLSQPLQYIELHRDSAGASESRTGTRRLCASRRKIN